MTVAFRGARRFLSNFYPAPVFLDESLYPSTENAFQAAKTLDLEERKMFLNCTAAEAKRYGNQVRLRSDWFDVRYDVMLDLVRQKFTRHENLRTQLLATGSDHLAEINEWHDNIWGFCLCVKCKGKGDNWLGKILMTVRGELGGTGVVEPPKAVPVTDDPW